MKIDQYCQRHRCKHFELEQFWHAFASRGFVSDSWAFLFNFEATATTDKYTATAVVYAQLGQRTWCNLTTVSRKCELKQADQLSGVNGNR